MEFTRHAFFYFLICFSFASQAKELGLILIGDSGSDNVVQKKVSKAIKKYCNNNPCEMGLLLGDNIYPDGVVNATDPQFASKFEHAYQNLPFTFYPVLGNHDMVGNWEAEIEYASPHWDMQGRFYRLYQDFVAIYAIDSNLYINRDDIEYQSQVNWLEHELSTSDSTWKLVYGHHPVFSSGLHGNTKELIERLNPLLEKYGVDFYASAHDHDLELIEHGENNYIVSGASSNTRIIRAKANSLFASGVPGFTHLLFKDGTATVTFVDTTNEVLFTKTYRKSTLD